MEEDMFIYPSHISPVISHKPQKYYQLLELGGLPQSCMSGNVLREDDSRELTFTVSYLG